MLHNSAVIFTPVRTTKHGRSRIQVVVGTLGTSSLPFAKGKRQVRHSCRRSRADHALERITAATTSAIATHSCPPRLDLTYRIPTARPRRVLAECGQARGDEVRRFRPTAATAAAAAAVAAAGGGGAGGGAGAAAMIVDLHSLQPRPHD